MAPVNQNTLEPADNDDGQDDALIFVGLELAGQALSGFPDVGGEIVEFGYLERKSSELRYFMVSRKFIARS